MESSWSGKTVFLERVQNNLHLRCLCLLILGLLIGCEGPSNESELDFKETAATLTMLKMTPAAAKTLLASKAVEGTVAVAGATGTVVSVKSALVIGGAVVVVLLPAGVGLAGKLAFEYADLDPTSAARAFGVLMQAALDSKIPLNSGSLPPMLLFSEQMELQLPVLGGFIEVGREKAVIEFMTRLLATAHRQKKKISNKTLFQYTQAANQSELGQDVVDQIVASLQSCAGTCILPKNPLADELSKLAASQSSSVQSGYQRVYDGDSIKLNSKGKRMYRDRGYAGVTEYVFAAARSECSQPPFEKLHQYPDQSTINEPGRNKCSQEQLDEIYQHFNCWCNKKGEFDMIPKCNQISSEDPFQIGQYVMESFACAELRLILHKCHANIEDPGDHLGAICLRTNVATCSKKIERTSNTLDLDTSQMMESIIQYSKRIRREAGCPKASSKPDGG